MLLPDHLIMPTIYTFAVVDKFHHEKIKVSTLLLISYVVNFIDFDHLIYYHLDHGVVNSLALHPGHLYAGCLIFLIAFTGLILTRFSLISLFIIGAYTLHLLCDALAYVLSYNLYWLSVGTVLEIVIMYLLMYKKMSLKSQRHFILCLMILAWCINTAIISIVVMVLGYMPHEVISIYLGVNLMTVLIVLLFWRKFYHQDIELYQNLSLKSL